MIFFLAFREKHTEVSRSRVEKLYQPSTSPNRRIVCEIFTTFKTLDTTVLVLTVGRVAQIAHSLLFPPALAPRSLGRRHEREKAQLDAGGRDG